MCCLTAFTILLLCLTLPVAVPQLHKRALGYIYRDCTLLELNLTLFLELNFSFFGVILEELVQLPLGSNCGVILTL